MPHAAGLAQTRTPVGVSETDVLAALGQPQRVLYPGDEMNALSRRAIDDHALLYFEKPTSIALGNWILVYISQDGLVECSVATITGSE
jgi:hypothetical protein